MTSIESIGESLVKGLFRNVNVDVTVYCNAAVDACYEYTIDEFKKACTKAGITWKKKWEDILYGE